MAVIKLKKNEALKLLEEAYAKAEAECSYNSTIAEGEALIESMSKVDPYKDRVAAWHREVAEGIDAGTITFTAKGTITGAPKKPTPSGDEVIANKLGSNRYRNGYYSNEYYGVTDVEGVQRVVDQYKKYKYDGLSGLRAQIALFKMSAEDVIEVDQGNFHSLLAGGNQRW